MEVAPAREVVPRIQALVEIFREKRLPVVFTEFTYSPAAPLLVGALHPEHRPAEPGMPTGFGRPSSSCLVGDPHTAVIPELAPRADELVVRKHYYDGFNDTVDRVFDRLWNGDGLTWADIQAASDEAKGSTVPA